MHASTKSIICFFALFATLVGALPMPLSHHARRGCLPRGVSSTKATATASLNARSTKTISSTSTATAKVPAAAVKGPASAAALFPSGNNEISWSTSNVIGSPLPLSDSTFRPTSNMASLPHNYVTAPDGKQSLQAHYPAGSYTLEHYPIGGLSFYAPGPSYVDLTTAKEATFGYSVYFQEGFKFNLGGKLPGFYGGNSEDEAQGCSGGARKDSCFSARFMWREGGAGEFYTYLPPSFSANNNICTLPESTCNPTYGASIGRGSFHFAAGTRTTITERVLLNDVGEANGELELFADGESVIHVKGLVLRNSDAGRIRGIMMQTFFGGHTEQYASPMDQSTYFSDFSVAILQKL